MTWQSFESAPFGREILATDGEWTAVVIVTDFGARRSVRVHHWVVTQEYEDWTPTHWCELPEKPS